MELNFTKMQGSGNDFIVINGFEYDVDHVKPKQWQALADRHFGIGADQILVVKPPRESGADFRYVIFNQDGSRVENCGNGARCFVKYVVEKGLTNKRSITVELITGRIMTLLLNDDESVTVNMGAPSFLPEDLPACVEGLPKRLNGDMNLYQTQVNQESRWLSLVSMGNPHAVQIVDELTDEHILADGIALQNAIELFPNKVNAGFLQVINPHQALVRVYERGAGETLACGTGICAAVVSGIFQGQLSSPVQVQAKGGSLSVQWDGMGTAVMMTGPAVTVFEGCINI